jgi:argininosuccinate lyase
VKDKKLWGGRFSGESSEITERMSASIRYDSRLYRQDIRGSIAHAKMLARMGVLSQGELDAIAGGLRDIEREIDEGRFEFSRSLEDIHMNIEARLTERIGEAGRRLHTARSRNDQVALDTRLFIRDEADAIGVALGGLISLLGSLAEKYIDVIMPGYTHLQVAQPVRFSQHLLAHAYALSRDAARLAAVRAQCSIMPLGVGALAGVIYEHYRDFLRDELCCSDITRNSMDTTSDRDYLLDFLYFAAVAGMHLSRMSEEIVLWSSSEFGFIRLSDHVTTGSSIMPQKRNPDLAELIRGKCGRLYGNLMSMLTTMKGLPLCYNRDLQEDKEPLFDSVDTIAMSIEAMCEMLATMTVNAETMRAAVYRNFSTATDLADYLVKKGTPFREAHGIIGSIVRFCEDEGRDYFSLDLDTLRRFSPRFDDDAVACLSPEMSTERKLSSGSTSKKEILAQIEHLKGLAIP